MRPSLEFLVYRSARPYWRLVLGWYRYLSSPKHWFHRDPQFNNVMPIESRALVSRIWWSCVIHDRWLSLAKGRPMRICDEDCDVPMPLAKDIFNELQAIDPKIGNVLVPNHSDLLSETWIGLMKTSFHLGQILRIYYRVRGPQPSTQEIKKIASDLRKVGQM